MRNIRKPTASRLMRRGGVWIMMWAVLAGMGLEWLHHRISELFGPMFRKLGLDRIAPWLADRSLWYLVPIAIVLVPTTLVLKWAEFSLIFSAYWPLGVLLGLALKAAAVGLGNMFVNAYAARVLSIRRARIIYEAYTRLRDEIRAFIRAQAWYRGAKERVTILAYAYRSAQMHQCCLSCG